MESDSPLSTNFQTPLKFSKFRIIKNLVVMSLSMMLISTAYDGLSMLQSTLNQEKGTASQAMVYTAQCVSSLILPKYVVKKFGCKLIFVTSVALFLPYIASNFYPMWFTLIFTAIFMGIAISIMFASQTLYFNESVLLYCRSDSTTKENNSDSESCIREESILNCFGRADKKNLHLDSNSTATRAEAVPRRRTSSQIHPKGSDNCTEVNKRMIILKVQDLRQSENSSEDSGTKNDSPIKNLTCKNEEASSLADPAPTTCEDSIMKDTVIQTSSIGKYCINYKCSEDENSFRRFSSPSTTCNDETSAQNTRNKSMVFKNNKLAQSTTSNGDPVTVSFVSTDNYKEITSNIEPKFNIQNLETLNNNDSVNHVTLGIQHDENEPRNHAALDVEHERNKPKETIDFTRQNIESVTARFFGASGLAFHLAQVWGNLITYFALNSSEAFPDRPPCGCGATLCRTATACFAEESSDGTEDRYLLTGISFGIAVLALLLGIFLLDPLGTEKDPSVKISLDNLMATFRQLKKKTQLCLVPISLYVGMLQGFYTADFTKSYIVCALDPSRVGLVTAVYGLSCALSSPLAGFLVKYTGRIPVFLLMQSANLSVLLLLLVWSPNSENINKFYAVACLLGVVTGTQWSHIPAFHGILFKEDQEAAFASYYLFNALGWSVSFTCSDHLCTSYKLYVLLSVSCLGIVGYLIAERTYYKKTTKTNDTSISISEKA